MKKYLLGAIAGDVCGSTYECDKFFKRTHSKPDIDKLEIYFSGSKFTDDTVCTCAIADALMNPIEEGVYDFGGYLKKWAISNPNRGYGATFDGWFRNHDNVIGYSYGNGSAMRVSPIGFFAKDLVSCRILAQQSAQPSHNHIEGIRGAQAIAECVFKSFNYNHDIVKDEIRKTLALYYPEWINKTLDEIRPVYSFKVSCQESVPVAILAFLESDSFEHAIKLAISMRADSDTLASMAGSIALQYYQHIEPKLLQYVNNKLSDEIYDLIDRFDNFILAQ